MSGLLKDEGVPHVSMYWWRLRRRALYWLARRMHVPPCDGCAVPITGFSVYGGEGAENLCAECAASCGIESLVRSHDHPR